MGNKEINSFFDRASLARDQEFSENPILGHEQNARHQAISSLLDGHYAIALDAGCGNGRDFRMLLNCIDEIVGVDFSEGMVRGAKSKINKAGLTDAAVLQASVTCLPFKNNSFDLVVCSEVLEHVPEWRKAISEFKRVLKPNGELIISTPNKLSMYGLTRYLGRLLLSSKHPYDKWKSYFELRNALKSYGFEVNQAKGACYLPGDIGYYQPFKRVIVSCLGVIKFLERTFLSQHLPFKLLGYMIVIKSRKLPIH